MKLKHMNVSVLKTGMPHEPLCEEKIKVKFNGKDHNIVHHGNDIGLLFNQKRLDKLGKDGVTSFLNSLVPKSDSLSKLRKKCTDQELIAICKSRYIQTPSELLAWSDYLNYNYEYVSTTAKDVIKEETDKVKDNDVVKNDDVVSE